MSKSRKKPRGPKPRLANGDLELLEVLWRLGEATLAEAHRAIGREVGYTTVQTRLNRLVDKGLAAKTDTRPAAYRAAVERGEVLQTDLDTLVSQVNDGKVVPLVAHLVKDRSLSHEEIAELRSLIDEAARNLQSGDGDKSKPPEEGA